MSQDLIKSLDKLIEAGFGDTGRLQHIRKSLLNGIELYKSDKKFLEAVLTITDIPDKKEESKEEKSDIKSAITASPGPKTKVAKSTVKMVKPTVSVTDVEKYAKITAEKNSKGGFLGRGKVNEKAIGWQFFLYPYYDVKINVTINAVEKRGWFKKEKITKTIDSRTSVDGITGAIVDVRNDGISYVYAFLKDLDIDQLNLLYYVSSLSSFTITDLRGLDHSDSKSRRLADGLWSNGILSKKSGRPAIYSSKYPYPKNPANFISLMEKYQIADVTTEAKKIDPRISQHNVDSYATRYWTRCSTNGSTLVFYPYYGILYQRDDHTRTEVIDGMTGIRQPRIENLVTVEPVNKIE